MSNSPFFPNETAFGLFWSDVQAQCQAIALGRDAVDLDDAWMHIFVQRRKPDAPHVQEKWPSLEDYAKVRMLPLQHFHLPIDTQADFEPADFVATTVVGKNPITGKRWLACMGQDSSGQRKCFYLELIQIERRPFVRGPILIDGDTMDEAEGIIHLAAELRLEKVLALTGTGKEAQNAE